MSDETVNVAFKLMSGRSGSKIFRNVIPVNIVAHKSSWQIVNYIS